MEEKGQPESGVGPFQRAYERTAEDRAELAEHELLPINLDILSLVALGKRVSEILCNLRSGGETSFEVNV